MSGHVGVDFSLYQILKLLIHFAKQSCKTSGRQLIYCDFWLSPYWGSNGDLGCNYAVNPFIKSLLSYVLMVNINHVRAFKVTC